MGSTPTWSTKRGCAERAATPRTHMDNNAVGRPSPNPHQTLTGFDSHLVYANCSRRYEVAKRCEEMGYFWSKVGSIPIPCSPERGNACLDSVLAERRILTRLAQWESNCLTNSGRRFDSVAGYGR